MDVELEQSTEQEGKNWKKEKKTFFSQLSWEI